MVCRGRRRGRGRAFVVVVVAATPNAHEWLKSTAAAADAAVQETLATGNF